jgi:CyaY protein
MTDQEYLTLAEAALTAIERSVDKAEADIEFERSGNVLTLEFENRTKLIVNLQPPKHEIWLAAKAVSVTLNVPTPKTRRPLAAAFDWV